MNFQAWTGQQPKPNNNNDVNQSLEKIFQYNQFTTRKICSIKTSNQKRYENTIQTMDNKRDSNIY